MTDDNETAKAHDDTRYVMMPGEPVYDIETRAYLVDSSAWPLEDKPKQIFTNIYEKNKWGSMETRSGSGSERGRTQGVQQGLGRLIRMLGVRSLLDIPCGDFNWMNEINLSGVDYVGADIVDELIHDTVQRHGGPSRSFIVRDFTRDPLPKADLFVCRDGLVHLSNAHALAAIKNIQQSSSTYLLATNFADTKNNKNIVTGWWRPVNLCLPPFSFPVPLTVISDSPSDDFYSDKVLALWRISDLPSKSLVAPPRHQ